MTVHAGALTAGVSSLAATHRFVQIPTDTERSGASGYETGSCACLNLELPNGPLDPGRQAELLGALVALLHRYTQQAELALDVFVRAAAGQSRIALDVAVAGDGPVSTVINAVRAGLAEAVADPARDAVEAAAASNVAVTFVLASAGIEGSFDMSAWVDSAPAGYDVHFVVGQTLDATLLGMAYNAKLFRPSGVSRLLDGYVALLGAARRDGAALVERLPLLDEAGVRALTVEQDSGTASYPESPVHCLFGDWARRQPEALAAAFHGYRVAYGELDKRSSQLAHHLVARGVGLGIAVAVCVGPSPNVLVAMLAIRKAGVSTFPSIPRIRRRSSGACSRAPGPSSS